MVLLGCLLHWQQAYRRCLAADERARTTRRELEATEAALKEWPQLRAQASHIRPASYREPQQLKHETSMQLSFQPVERTVPPQYRLSLSGPRSAALAELLSLTEHFWLESVDLKSPSGDRVVGEAVLRAVP
jgi:hypothetical protein